MVPYVMYSYGVCEYCLWDSIPAHSLCRVRAVCTLETFPDRKRIETHLQWDADRHVFTQKNVTSKWRRAFRRSAER
jgi:hypothetical protein